VYIILYLVGVRGADNNDDMDWPRVVDSSVSVLDSDLYEGEPRQHMNRLVSEKQLDTSQTSHMRKKRDTSDVTSDNDR